MSSGNAGNTAEQREQREKFKEEVADETNIANSIEHLAKAKEKLAQLDGQMGYDPEAKEMKKDAAGLFESAARHIDRAVEDRERERALGQGKNP